jgi:hypothetical protein
VNSAAARSPEGSGEHHENLDPLAIAAVHVTEEAAERLLADFPPALARVMDHIVGQQSEEGVHILGIERPVIGANDPFGFCHRHPADPCPRESPGAL